MKIMKLIENKIIILGENHPILSYFVSIILLPLSLIMAVSVFTAVFAVPAAYLFGLV